MKLNRFGAALSVVTAGALALSGCGSDNNASGGSATSGSSLGKVSCGGKKTLKASGSTAQANAMTRFVNAFEQACSGQTLNYTANGSGGGIGDFTSDRTDFAGSDTSLAPIEYFVG
ncbi:MAG: substrate-binding domain-containing protein, partial [Mycobacterium sp.]